MAGRTVEDGTALGADEVGVAGGVPAAAVELPGVAERAVERRAEAGCPPGRVLDPGPIEEGGPVPHVLAVLAREQGDPVALLVLLPSDDRTLHPRSS